MYRVRMESLAPIHSVTSNLSLGEVSFTVTGFCDHEAIETLHADLDRHAFPIFKAGKKIHVLGNMDGFVPQSRETGDAIRAHLTRAQNFNLTRVAIYNASALVKQQYKRISTGIDVAFFDNRTDALRWLRRPYEDAA